MDKKTSIILLTYNHLELTKDCIESIRKYTKKGTYEIIVVDNASTDGTKDYLQKQKDLKVIYNEENRGFPTGCNQGIQISSKKNDLLLLNNDTIVTTNWLLNLKTCLYSDSSIGAVGAVSNHNENNSGVSFTYNDFNEMQKKAKENNISNPEKWEEKAFLIGFCLLIKREVIEKIGLLDENYTPGYIEDNDLSLRIIKSGYRLMLCHDAFIHHYLGSSFRKDLNKFYPILYKNRDYFYKKWHFDTFVFDEVKHLSYPLMEEYKTILDLNASIGVNLLELKYRYKNSQIEGVEENAFKREMAGLFANVYSHLNEAKSYDCILIGTILETIKDPNSFLEELKKHLNEGGVVIGEIENASSIFKIQALLNGKSRGSKNSFTKQELIDLFTLTGYKDFYFYSWYSTEENNLNSIVEQYPETKFTYYTFRIKK